MTNPLDYKAVTNMYLYGSESTPSDKTSGSLIRNKDVTTSLSFEQSDVMATLGRFAVGAQFGLVKSFFGDNTIAAGNYTKAQLDARYSLNNRLAFTLQQKNYADGSDDYAERTYIWNNMNFKINDNAVFKVDANKNKTIENFSVFAIEQINDQSAEENFDFTSTSDNSIGNTILQGWIDPSGIGRKVDLNFTGTMPTYTYTRASYNADLAKMQTWSSPFLYPTTYNAMSSVADKLFFQPEGVSEFLDSNGRVIMYGSDEADILSAYSTEKVNRYLTPNLSNGVVLLGGKGNDNLTGGTNGDKLDGGDDNDNLIGGEGADTYVLSSGAEDVINDTREDDKIEGFAGEATEKGEGSGIYELSGTVENVAANDNLIIDEILTLCKVSA